MVENQERGSISSVKRDVRFVRRSPFRGLRKLAAVRYVHAR